MRPYAIHNNIVYKNTVLVRNFSRFLALDEILYCTEICTKTRYHLDFLVLLNEDPSINLPLIIVYWDLVIP